MWRTLKSSASRTAMRHLRINSMRFRSDAVLG